MSRTLTLSSETIERARSISGTELHRLPVDARHVVLAVTAAARACPECARDAGHTVDCSNHYSKRPTTTDCTGCHHGQYGPASAHTCSAWSDR